MITANLLTKFRFGLKLKQSSIIFDDCFFIYTFCHAEFLPETPVSI